MDRGLKKSNYFEEIHFNCGKSVIFAKIKILICAKFK